MNPHKEFTREWIEHEDKEWRDLMESGAVDHYAKRLAEDKQQQREHKTPRK